MGSLILTGVEYLADKVVGAVVWFFASIANAIDGLALLQTQFPWVVNLNHDIEAVAWSLLGVYFAYKAFHAYIMWNEGTADPDGSVLVKSLLRTMIYVGISGFLATAVFRWGLDLAQVIAASPMASTAQLLQNPQHGLLLYLHEAVNTATTTPQAVIGAIFGVILAICGGVILLVVAAIQMAIRAAELVVYVVAAPLVALGQMNPDGGTWSGWWSNLVILSLSQAVTILCFKGFVGTMEWITSPTMPKGLQIVLAAMSAGGGLGPAAGIWIGYKVLLAAVLMIGWMVVAIRGPHLLKQWAYHSGVGGAMMYVGTRVGPQVLSKTPLANTKIGAFFKP